MPSYGFLSPTTTFLSDGSLASWIHAAPLGTYHHPVYGKIELTAERVSQFAQSVKEKVRGQELDIDYDHKERDGRAAGWVKDADARADGLWLLVEWTEDAYNDIKKKAYRYFSPEFADEWEHPVTKQKYKNVLFGGGLTNRPYLKGILPINLSEAFAASEGEPQKEEPVDEKVLQALRKKLGLADDATEEQVLAAVTAEEEPEEEPKDEPKEEVTEEPKAEEPQLVNASEVQALNDRIAQLEVAARMSETSLRLREMSDSKKYALPAKFHDEAKALLVESPRQLSDRWAKMLGEILDTGLVERGERGAGRTVTPEGQSAAQTFTEKVDKLVEGGKSFEDAVTQVSRDNPELYEEYRIEVIKAEEF